MSDRVYVLATLFEKRAGYWFTYTTILRIRDKHQFRNQDRRRTSTDEEVLLDEDFQKNVVPVANATAWPWRGAKHGVAGRTNPRH
jgi:hypothetical protein